MTIAMTMATIGRLIKNFDMVTGRPTAVAALMP
jgi:hypothetical protein